MARRLRTPDARALGVLAAALLALTLVSWRRWGVPSFDVGLDLTVADLIAHGQTPYADTRYFYGPAGVYALALAFELLGSSLEVAFGFGYALTLAILGGFYALARQWLAPVASAAATALLMAIAFSGTFFDYVLPHTFAGTVGALFLILQVLALARGRELAAGACAGVLCLTRPEFALFGAAVGAGAVLGSWREGGGRPAARTLALLAVPALAVAALAYVPLGAAAGFERLFLENIVPLDFASVAGERIQGRWAPLTISSFVATLARGAIFLALAVGLVAAAGRWAAAAGAAGRLRALAPLALAGAGLVVAGALWRLSGAFPAARADVWDDVARLLIAMSWLPLPALAVLAWALRRAWRRGPAPGVGWRGDLALAFGAAACGARAYNDFTPDSYAPYWAALPVLVATIAVTRLAPDRPAERAAAIAIPAIAALALAVHAYVGLYRDDVTRVATPHGEFRWYADGGPAVERVTRYLDAGLAARDPILVLPDSPGIHFLSGHPSALYESTFLPGTLDSAADERAAVRRLERLRPRYVVVGAQRTENFGFAQIGVDYNRVLMAYVRRRYAPVARFGDVERPTRDNQPPRAFTVLERRR